MNITYNFKRKWVVSGGGIPYKTKIKKQIEH